jgi:hypothetical protein
MYFRCDFEKLEAEQIHEFIIRPLFLSFVMELVWKKWFFYANEMDLRLACEYILIYEI